MAHIGDIIGISSALTMATHRFASSGVLDVFEKPMPQSEVTKIIAGVFVCMYVCAYAFKSVCKFTLILLAHVLYTHYPTST